MRSASHPCSPVHLHEGHAKLASSPPRASPVRMGPSYVLKKGSGERAGREGGQGIPAWSSGLGWKPHLWLPFLGLERSLPGAGLPNSSRSVSEPSNTAGTRVGPHPTDDE